MEEALLSKGNAGEAAMFRAYYTEVPDEIREEIYEEILACEVNGDPDAFERLTVRILAHTAAAHITPSMSKACHDLLALISHSIIARKTSTVTATLTATVSQTLSKAAKLDKKVQASLPDYGNLEAFVSGQKTQPQVIDVEAVPLEPKPTVRLKRGR